jgi:hypothetical protein
MTELTVKLIDGAANIIGTVLSFIPPFTVIGGIIKDFKIDPTYLDVFNKYS